MRRYPASQVLTGQAPEERHQSAPLPKPLHRVCVFIQIYPTASFSLRQFGILDGGLYVTLYKNSVLFYHQEEVKDESTNPIEETLPLVSMILLSHLYQYQYSTVLLVGP